jgi:hypothetical protein
MIYTIVLTGPDALTRRNTIMDAINDQHPYDGAGMFLIDPPQADISGHTNDPIQLQDQVRAIDPTAQVTFGVTWVTSFSERKFLPTQADRISDVEGAILDHARNPSSWRVDEMTDQFDVYCGNRKVATYMAN